MLQRCSGRVHIPENNEAYVPIEEHGLVLDACSFPLRKVTRVGWKVKSIDKNTHLSVRFLGPRPDGLAQETQRRACVARRSGDGGAGKRLARQPCAS